MASARERVLVTGAGGFVGAWLVPLLEGQGREVLGVGHGGGSGVVPLDVRDTAALEVRTREFAPDAVVHLAARTYLPEVWADPAGSFSVNVLGTLSLLEAVLAAAPAARVLLVSTGIVYGDPEPSDLPLRENSPLRSVHPYGVHKIGTELLGERFRGKGLDVVVARPFNHVGAGMDARISLMHFATQIAEAEAGGREPRLLVGNLEARRDFLDVADVVRAYALLLDHPDPPSPVNVCSGRSVAVGEALEVMIRAARVPLEVVRDAGRYRPIDVPELRGDATRLREATGWEPAVSLETTLMGILESARRRHRA